jgi:deoxyribodipyrimidine photolyase-related protein
MNSLKLNKSSKDKVLKQTNAFLILPIHLFQFDVLLEHIKPHIDQLKTIYILEEPVYFGDRQTKLNFNKLKLIYHRATMRYYFDYLNEHLYNNKGFPKDIKLEYLEYKSLTSKSGYSKIKKSNSDILLFNPIDTYLEAKYKKLFSSRITYLETPQFLCTSADLAYYHSKKQNKDSYFHASFYNWQRERLNILTNSKTYDTENRNMMPSNITVPGLPKNDSTIPATKKYLDEAIKYVQTNWSNNLEPIYIEEEGLDIIATSIQFPISHKTSIQWLEHFCTHRFHLFGQYEDSIDGGNKQVLPRNFLFHSVITPMLNIGLITPQEVISVISDYYNKNKAQIGIANYEGFIRQIIGWREYQRYIYQYAGNIMRAGNYFNNSKKLTPEWYNGTTSIKPVDDAIKMAVNDGYIHHILRLMVVGNFMNLVGMHPDEVYKWFMEFSLDSYDWVMVGNVYSMTLWADGGLTMRKPYISGDGYIMKMSNYSRGEWNSKWNAVFHHFVDRTSKQLEKTYYNGLVKAWNRKTDDAKKEELTIANEIIKRISK